MTLSFERSKKSSGGCNVVIVCSTIFETDSFSIHYEAHSAAAPKNSTAKNAKGTKFFNKNDQNLAPGTVLSCNSPIWHERGKEFARGGKTLKYEAGLEPAPTFFVSFCVLCGYTTSFFVAFATFVVSFLPWRSLRDKFSYSAPSTPPR
jgi:hypothetical protein